MANQRPEFKPDPADEEKTSEQENTPVSLEFEVNRELIDSRAKVPTSSAPRYIVSRGSADLNQDRRILELERELEKKDTEISNLRTSQARQEVDKLTRQVNDLKQSERELKAGKVTLLESLDNLAAGNCSRRDEILINLTSILTRAEKKLSKVTTDEVPRLKGDIERLSNVEEEMNNERRRATGLQSSVERLQRSVDAIGDGVEAMNTSMVHVLKPKKIAGMETINKMTMPGLSEVLGQ